MIVFVNRDASDFIIYTFSLSLFEVRITSLRSGIRAGMVVIVFLAQEDAIQASLR